MNIQPEKYVRRPFEVEAVEVTPENMLAVAAWCGGTVHIDDDSARIGQQYIQVQVKKPLSPRQSRAYHSDWVLLATTSDPQGGAPGFKVYTPRAFVTSFQKQVDNMLDVVERMETRATNEEKAEDDDQLQLSDLT